MKQMMELTGKSRSRNSLYDLFFFDFRPLVRVVSQLTRFATPHILLRLGVFLGPRPLFPLLVSIHMVRILSFSVGIREKIEQNLVRPTIRQSWCNQWWVAIFSPPHPPPKKKENRKKTNFISLYYYRFCRAVIIRLSTVNTKNNSCNLSTQWRECSYFPFFFNFKNICKLSESKTFLLFFVVEEK